MSRSFCSKGHLWASAQTRPSSGHCLGVLSAAPTADKSQTQRLASEPPELPQLERSALQNRAVRSFSLLQPCKCDTIYCACVWVHMCVCVYVRVCVCVRSVWFRGSCLFRLSVYESGSGSSSQRYNSVARLLKIFQILP